MSHFSNNDLLRIVREATNCISGTLGPVIIQGSNKISKFYEIMEIITNNTGGLIRTLQTILVIKFQIGPEVLSKKWVRIK